MNKRRILIQTPTIIGMFVLQEAKLQMLHYAYDCLDRFFQPNAYEILYTDMDNLILALAGADGLTDKDSTASQQLDQWDSLIKPELMEQWRMERHVFLPMGDELEEQK